MIIGSCNGGNQDVDDDVNVKIRKNAAFRDVVNQKKRSGMVHDSHTRRPCDTENYCHKGLWASHVSPTSSGMDRDTKFGPHLDPGLKRDPTFGGPTRLKTQHWTFLMPALTTKVHGTASKLYFRLYYGDRGGLLKTLIPYVHRDQMMEVFEGYCPELDDSPLLEILQEDI